MGVTWKEWAKKFNYNPNNFRESSAPVCRYMNDRIVNKLGKWTQTELVDVSANVNGYKLVLHCSVRRFWRALGSRCQNRHSRWSCWRHQSCLQVLSAGVRRRGGAVPTPTPGLMALHSPHRTIKRWKWKKLIKQNAAEQISSRFHS